MHFLGRLLCRLYRQALQQYRFASVVKGINTESAAKPVVSMHINSACEWQSLAVLSDQTGSMLSKAWSLACTSGMASSLWHLSYSLVHVHLLEPLLFMTDHAC